MIRLRHLSRAAVAAALLVPVRARAQHAPPDTTPVAAHAPTYAATMAAPVAVITLDPWRTRWTISAVVGGRPRRFLFDTGAGLTFVSAGVAKDAGCTPWGRVTGFNMFGRRGDTPRCDGVAFEVGGQRFTPTVTGLIDMGQLNPRDADLDGLVGLNLFGDRPLTLDLSGGHIVVESDASLAERVRGMTPLPVRVNREASGAALALYVGVPSKQGTLWMELDSGNGGTVLVSAPVASLLGLDPNAKGKQSGDFPVAGNARVRSDDVFIADMTIDGNLGMPFLRHWLLTVDPKGGRAWLTPAK